jgi:hypothetical protein
MRRGRIARRSWTRTRTRCGTCAGGIITSLRCSRSRSGCSEGESDLAVPPWSVGDYGSRVEGQLLSRGLRRRPVLTRWLVQDFKFDYFFPFLVLSLSLISWHHFEALFDFFVLFNSSLDHAFLCCAHRFMLTLL